MLIVQEFNSLHDIDPEFIPALELLLKEEVPNFHFIERAQDQAPEGDLFTYFLFFGPTQNTPIGFGQVCLRKVPWENYLSFWQRLWKKICFWNKDQEHWKEVIWNVFGGNSGVCLFDARFARSGYDKMQSLIHEYEKRSDIVAHDIHDIKGLQNFKLKDLTPTHLRARHVLEALPKNAKSYQDYLGNLPKEAQKEIKAEWKKLGPVNVGDYLLPAKDLDVPFTADELSLWESWGATLLTFEHDKKILGCILMVPGKDGNYFFEPYPFEPENHAVVSDQMYIQYALLKFHEVKGARRCHIMKGGTKLTFTDKKELDYFLHQGFQAKEVSEVFYSRLEGLVAPI